MKADRSGTPSEQSRHNAGWLSGGPAGVKRKTGAIPGDQSCAMCKHLGSTAGNWRCSNPDHQPTRGWSTGLRCHCRRFSPAGSTTTTKE